MPTHFWDPLGHNNQQKSGDALASLEALEDVWGRGWMVGDDDEDGDRDDDVGGGHDSNDNGTGDNDC